MHFRKRIEVWKDTVLSAPPCKSPSIMYSHNPSFVPPAQKYNTIVCVVDADLIDVGKLFQKYNPLVLNLADDLYPGGCVDTGSGAAEESFFRRSNYFRTLTYDFYPIRPCEAVYSPHVTVFKESEECDFARCDPYALAFIACPGIRNPELGGANGDGRMSATDLTILERKIELVFQVAVKNKHTIVILGALGCGVWHGNPVDVAETFKKVIERYHGVFKTIVFAIKQDPVNKENNYKVFKRILRRDL